MISPSSGVSAARRPRMVFLVTEYYFFYAMQKDLAPESVRQAFDVQVVAYLGNSAGKPIPSDLTVIDFPWRRSKSLIAALFQFFPEFLRVRRLLGELRPDVLHNIALKPSILGTLAVWDLPSRIVNTLTGLGFLFFARSPIARMGQRLALGVLARAVRRRDAQIVVHNSIDRDFAERRFGEKNVHLIGGLGIDTTYFTPQPAPPAPPFRFLVIARLLYMKGIGVAVAAHEILRRQGLYTELVICGGPDEDNPSAIPQHVIDGWAREPGVRFIGQVSDVRGEIAKAHVLIHPALGGEGLPRVLMEASACHRPLIASNIGGNSDIVIDLHNGLLVKPGDAQALADAMMWMIEHPEERARMGVQGRARVLEKFASHHVAESYAGLYRELMNVPR